MKEDEVKGEEEEFRYEGRFDMGSDSSDRSFFDDDTRMNPGSNFVYSHFDKNEDFRVLVLHSSKATKRIHVNLPRSSYPHIPGYEAVPYIWGNSNITHYTGCRARAVVEPGDDAKFPTTDTFIGVSASLNVILEGLRHTDQKRLLWIDGICTYSSRSRIDHCRK
jgi:hypothetical protein